jgi:hypothetical protein
MAAKERPMPKLMRQTQATQATVGHTKIIITKPKVLTKYRQFRLGEVVIAIFMITR